MLVYRQLNFWLDQNHNFLEWSILSKIISQYSHRAGPNRFFNLLNQSKGFLVRSFDSETSFEMKFLKNIHNRIQLLWVLCLRVLEIFSSTEILFLVVPSENVSRKTLSGPWHLHRDNQQRHFILLHFFDQRRLEDLSAGHLRSGNWVSVRLSSMFHWFSSWTWTHIYTNGKYCSL